MFHTAYEIKQFATAHGGTPRPLVGVSIGGRLGVVYSQDGLNDTPALHRLLLLRRQRASERDRDQREYPGLCADALMITIGPSEFVLSLLSVLACAALVGMPAKRPWPTAGR